MLRLVFSSVHSLFTSYASKIKKPIRFCPERDHSHLEQQKMAGPSLLQWLKESGPGIIYVFTHSKHFLEAAQLAILRGEIGKKQISVVYLYQSGDDIIEHEINFDDMGYCEPCPKGFWMGHDEACREICRLRTEKVQAKREAQGETGDKLVRKGFASEY